MSFPRYPSYKDSGVEWLGEVPAHWGIGQSRRLFALRNERALESDKQLTASQEHGVIYQEDFIRIEGRRVVEVIKGADILKHVEPNDFVISMRSFQGGIERCNLSGCISSAYVMLVPCERVHGPFFAYVLKCRSYIQALQTTSNLVRDGQALRYDNFTKVDLPLVPMSEQIQIAAFLDRETAKIDELVAEQRRLMELLKEKRQAVISHAVTQGLNPHAPMKPSGIEWLGDVPEMWAVVKLGRAVFMQEGPGLRTWQFTDEGTRVICVTNITERGIDFSCLQKFISTDEYKSTYRHFTVQPGDVLLSSSGNSWGKVAIYDGEEDVILNTSTIRLNESATGLLNRNYIAMLLQSVTVREQLGLAMTGSCQPNFGPTHLNCIMVAIPSREEQAAIIAYLDSETSKLDILTTEAQRAIDLLQERRTALISAAVTGQIDVRQFFEKQAA